MLQGIMQGTVQLADKQNLQKKHRRLTSKEEEDTPLHAAQHGHEALPNDEGEKHVHGHIEGASSCTDLQGLNFTAHSTKPCQSYCVSHFDAQGSCVSMVQCDDVHVIHTLCMR